MLLDLEEKTRVLVEDIVERSAIGRGAIFVLGLSSSEVAGGTIGKASSREIGQRIGRTGHCSPGPQGQGRFPPPPRQRPEGRCPPCLI